MQHNAPELTINKINKMQKGHPLGALLRKFMFKSNKYETITLCSLSSSLSTFVGSNQVRKLNLRAKKPAQRKTIIRLQHRTM